MRPDALPLCPNCWGLREQRVAPAKKNTRLETAGLWLGGLSFTCLPPIVLAGLVVNLMVISRAEPEAKRKGYIGLALTIGGGLVAFLVLVLAASRSGP
jgi:hypothetical protein